MRATLARMRMSAVQFTVGDACNNGCRGCLWTRRLDSRQPLRLPLSEDVCGRGVRLAGREPTLRDDLIDVVRALRGAGATGVELETNGRMLAYPKFVRSLCDAGVTRLAIKLFGCNEAAWDAHTRVPGSYAQTVRGISVAGRLAPHVDIVAVLVPRRDAGAGLRELVDFAHELGFRQARVELRLAKLDLATLRPLASEVRALRDHPPVGMRVDVATA
jgi:molybdenum cofactor biosynthesis enzyme MoaA